MLGGNIQAAFGAVAAVEPHVKGGKLKAIAVSGHQRASSLPNVATFAESGFPNFEANFYMALVAPAGTPSAVAQKVWSDSKKILLEPAFRVRFVDPFAYDVVTESPEEFSAFIRKDQEISEKKIRISGVKLDTSPRSDFVTALARGLAVIEVFSAEAPELTLTEVASRSGLSPATARRALITLEQLGYVGMTGKRFVLRPKVLGLGSAFLSSMNIRELVQPALQEIADRFKDAASMAVLDGDHVLYIAHVPSNRRIRFTGSVGSRSPAYATSLGLVLWAHLSEEALEERLSRAPFSAYTSQTLTQAEQLRAAVRTARERGFATAQEQLDYGIVAIAIPIRDSHGHVIASINCSSELARNDRETLVASRLESMRDTARQIEHGLKRFPALAHSLGGAANQQSGPSTDE